jgi:hypothetical protein
MNNKKNIILTESDIKTMVRNSLHRITENKTVTFNGEIFPNYGWAVILVGGISSGKSTVERDKLPINGKVINNDYWREILAHAINREMDDPQSSVTNITKSDKFKNLSKNRKNPSDKLDLSIKKDLDFVSNLALKDDEGFNLGNKYNDNLLKGFNGNYEILPNLIFEIGRDVPKNLNSVLKYLKSFNQYEGTGKNKRKVNGYKVALVWVISNRNVAFASMMNRDRQVGDMAFHSSHNGMYKEKDGVIDILKNPKFTNEIDEAWCVINSNYDMVDGTRIDRYLKSTENNNVIKLKKDKNSTFTLPKTIKFSDSDEKDIDDIIQHKFVQKDYVNPVKGIDDQDAQPIDDRHYPTKNQIQKWADSHDGQYIKNVDVYKKQSNKNANKKPNSLI